LTEEHVEYLEMAEVSAQRLNALVQRVCLLTQLKARSIPVIHDPFDLRDLAAQALEGVRGKVAEAGVTLVLAPGDPVHASGDAKLLGWVVGALLENAIQVSPRGGVVTLHVGLEASHPWLSVTDQGPGIEPDLVPRIFQEFVVADIKHHQKGSGLSLAAAHLAVEQNGGVLSMTTELKRGSVFHMELPAPQSAAAAA
jgi:signal transduction histidine kinase